MRARKRKNNQNNAAKAVGILLLLGICIYIAIATKAGNFIATKIVAPVFNFIDSKTKTQGNALENQQQPDEGEAKTLNLVSSSKTQEKQDAKSEEIALEPQTLYALQMGAFSTIENATKEGQNLQKLGAGGYVLKDEHYLVFSSMYYSQSDAKTVKEKLMSENNIESKIYTIDIPGAKLKVTAGQGKLDAVKEAFTTLESAQKETFSLCEKFDKKEVSKQQAIETLTTMLENAKKPEQELQGVGAGEIGEALRLALEETIELVEKCSDEKSSDVEFSANLKYLQMAQVCSYQKLSKIINANNN